MADVDLCVRYAELGLCSEPSLYALKICALPDSVKNIVFRGKTQAEIAEILVRFSDFIKKSFSEEYGFSCKSLNHESDNNREGADLYTVNPKTGTKITIEVKFGAHTDKAAGMENIERIFGTDVFTRALSLENRKKWREKLITEYPDMTEQKARTTTTLNRAISDFNLAMKEKNWLLSKKEQEYLEDYLFNHSGSYESCNDGAYIRFGINKTKMFVATPIEKERGYWQVLPVSQLDLDDEKSRVVIFAINPETHVKIKCVLNNKNNYHNKNLGVIRSKYLVGPPSANIWVLRAS